MAELGTVVALIKSMGGADPAVIEQAVQEWLDDHPEATTTVQDGSITEAKLAQDVLAELGEIEELKEAIENLEEGEGAIPYTTSSGYLQSNGTVHTPSGNAEVYTNKIAVKPGDKVGISLAYGTASNSIWIAVGQYDSTETWVSRIDLETSGTGPYTDVYTVPDGVYYLSFTYRTYGNATAIFTKQLPYVDKIYDVMNVGKKEVPYTTKPGWINGTGGIGSASSTNLEVYTETYFPVQPGDKIDLSLVYGDSTKTVWLAIAGYDASKNFIYRIEYDTTSVGSHTSIFTVPDKYYYLRFTYRTFGNATFKVVAPLKYVSDMVRQMNIESGGVKYTGERIILSDDNAPHWCNVDIWETYNSDNIPSGASASAVLGNNQSMTIFGGYMFLFSEYGGGAVIDISTKEMISTFTNEPTTYNHQNSAQFSDIYHTAGDEFPLLFVSRCGNASYSSGEHELDEILVYRVTRSGTDFTLTLVNSIFNPTQTYGMSWGVDNITHKLFCAGPLVSNYTQPTGNKIGFWIFDEPTKEEIISGTPITLSDPEAYFEMPYVTIQGCCVNGGKMYVGTTISPSHEMWVYDVVSGRVLSKMPIVQGWEIQGVSVYNGKIYTSNKSGNNVRIYEVTV